MGCLVVYIQDVTGGHGIREPKLDQLQRTWQRQLHQEQQPPLSLLAATSRGQLAGPLPEAVLVWLITSSVEPSVCLIFKSITVSVNPLSEAGCLKLHVTLTEDGIRCHVGHALRLQVTLIHALKLIDTLALTIRHAVKVRLDRVVDLSI
jgi:hypothetical protein